MILPREMIEIAISGQYDRTTACTDGMRVGLNGLGLANAKLDRELTVEGRHKALDLLTRR